ncbi:MAG: hypothetical protein P9L92_17190 [Candidatus Electryonea clarkiae]|nr:hypothetical protein [Candidatus Electryonea clarkiae]MDP8289305.1 hypothetical protein [Candidatus Electryonea clarkiae]
MSGKSRLLVGLVVAMFVFISSPVLAEDHPVQLSLFNPVQLFPEDDTITGIRLNLIYGKNASFTGIDWGMVNHTTQGKSLGYQQGMVGIADADFTGWQNNYFVNYVKGDFEGLQSGAFNYANYAHGLQLGIINYSGSMKGVQLGFVNIIKQGGQFPIFPFVNWSL